MYFDWGYMKNPSLWMFPQMLAAFKPKLCSHNNRCSSYSAGEHPNTFPRQPCIQKTVPSMGMLCQDGLFALQVVLPEGATSISAKAPFPVNQTREVKHTYLDTTGRPVVVLHKTNLVPDHNVEFTVNYSFFSLLMLREPFLLVSVFALLFASIIGWVRCDFVLSRDNKWHADRQKEKAVALVQKFTGIIAGHHPPPLPLPSPCSNLLLSLLSAALNN